MKYLIVSFNEDANRAVPITPTTYEYSVAKAKALELTLSKKKKHIIVFEGFYTCLEYFDQSDFEILEESNLH